MGGINIFLKKMLIKEGREQSHHATRLGNASLTDDPSSLDRVVVKALKKKEKKNKIDLANWEWFLSTAKAATRPTEAPPT